MIKKFTLLLFALIMGYASSAQDCENYFLVQQNDSTTFTFRGFMVEPGQTLYDWDFGDGATGSGKEVTHTFPQGTGIYEVCLFTQTFDTAGNICYDTSCQEITSGNPPGCIAFFFGSASLANPLAWSFTDFSSGTPTSWLWEFGDGATSSSQNAIHTYAEAGEYEVCLTIVDAVNNCEDQYCEVITVQGNIGWEDCFSDFTYDTDDQLTFDFTGFMLDTTQPATYYWEFGDGNTGTGQQVSHTYSPSGVTQYLVCLTTSVPFPNGDTCVYSICHNIIAGNTPDCQALFNWAFGSQPLTIVFSDLSLGDPNKFSWNFGDGTFSQQQNPTHVFPEVGTYEVCLTITNDTNGCTSVLCMDVNVSNAPPPISCYNTLAINPGSDIFTYNFHGEAYSNGNNVSATTSFTWNLGDGTFVNGQDQTHTYAQPGTYIVKLSTLSILNGTDSCSDNSIDTVTITDQSICLGGYVNIEGSNSADEASVYLVTYDLENSSIAETRSTGIDASGFYVFENLNPQTGMKYYVQAMLGEQSAWYGQYVPTYFADALHWDNADAVTTDECPPAIENNIIMKEAITGITGPGSISGKVYDGNTDGTLQNVEVLLFSESMEPITYDFSDEGGAFGFSSLAYGSYYVYPERVGISTDGFLVTLDEETQALSLNIILMNGEASLSVKENNPLNIIGHLYPNPAHTDINISVYAEKAMEANIYILNQLGQQMTVRTERLEKGLNTISAGIGHLPESIYYLRITSDAGNPVMRQFIKTR